MREKLSHPDVINLIKTLRSHHNLTQADIANQLGLSPSQYARHETNPPTTPRLSIDHLARKTLTTLINNTLDRL